MVRQNKAELRRNLFLKTLDPIILEFEYLTARATEEMVMMLVGVRLISGLIVAQAMGMG
jgi:hypothetical protein